MVGRLPIPRAILRTSFRIKRSRSPSRLIMGPKVCCIFLIRRCTKFNIGTQMEHEDSYHPQALSPQRSRSRGPSGPSDSWSISHNKSPRNTKIGRKVAHPTCNNAHQVRGQKVKVTWPINAETESVSHTNVKIGTPMEHATTS